MKAQAKHDAALRKYYHVSARQTFEEVGDGVVRVTADDGRTGLFRWSGEWIEGELTQCSAQMLLWCGGPNLPPDMNFRWVEAPRHMGTSEHPWPWPDPPAPARDEWGRARGAKR
ncbi:MAG: hypothetical protein JO127_04660 [Caulobacteraceae bacterium]|nr:hypothetical protein [Caulobacteraceae bacterium]